MNLPGRNQTEQEQKRYHQSKLVRSLLDKDYSVKQIIDLADVEELDLDRETVEEILSYEGVNKEVWESIANKPYNIYLSLSEALLEGYFRILVGAKKFGYYKLDEPLKETCFGFSLIGSLAYAGTVAVAAKNGFSNSPETYLAALGSLTNIASGLYEWHKHEKKKLFEQDFSELEQIANGVKE